MVAKYPSSAKNFISGWRNFFVGKGADPNKVLVSDLLNKKATNFERLGDAVTSNLSMESRKIFGELMAVYDTHIETKRQLLTKARILFDSDIVQTIIDVIMDDAFNSFIDEENEFRIEYRLEADELDNLGPEFEEEIQEEINKFVDEFDIKGKIADIVPELLRDGEYAMGALFEKDKGIVDVIDDLDVIDLLPFYTGTKLSFIIKEAYDPETTEKEKPIIYNPDNIIYFRLKYFSKERIKFKNVQGEYRKQFYQETGIYLPKTIRICRPIYYAAIKNISQLQIIENINTVQELARVLRPEVVNVTVPANTSPKEAGTIIRDYERQLNDMSTTVDQSDLDVSTLATLANRRKILPQWADGKGTIAGSDLNTFTKTGETREGITFLRNLIAVSVGIPPFYINITDTPIEKAQMAKMYSRYTRKLTALQKTLKEGVKDLVMLHLKNKGYFIERNNLFVDFKTLTNADSLDDTDMMVATITAMNDLYKSLDEITSSENNDLELNSEEFKNLFDTYTNKYMNVSDLLLYKPGGSMPELGSEVDDFNFTPSGNEFGGANPSPTSGEPSNVAGGEAGGDQAYNQFANSPSNRSQIQGNQEITTELT